MRSPFADRQLDAAYMIQQAEELRTLADSVSLAYPELASFLTVASKDFDAYARQADRATIAAQRADNLRARATMLDKCATAVRESCELLDKTVE